MNGGSPASARAPICATATVAASGGGFTLSVAQVKDDADGSGIDRVEFWNGNPASGGSLIATDEHDSNPDAGLAASDVYSISDSTNPGGNIFTRVYDQAGNSATCDAAGALVATSDLAQISPNITEDVTPPTIGPITVRQDPGGQAATATWPGSDDQTPAAQINYAYAVDVPFDQWDDPTVTIVGQVNTASVDISTLTEGQHTLYMIALDREGNIGSASQSFTVDRTPPKISQTNEFGAVLPDGGATGGNSMTVTGNDAVKAIPGSGVAAITLTLVTPKNGGAPYTENLGSC